VPELRRPAPKSRRQVRAEVLPDEGRTRTSVTDKSKPTLGKNTEEIVYPGELEARNEARHRAEGLLLPEDTRADLERLASEFDLKLPY
jgi:LDH2 family malate/lactate/ureidoglycolate dehydrogenase